MCFQTLINNAEVSMAFVYLSCDLTVYSLREIRLMTNTNRNLEVIIRSFE